MDANLLPDQQVPASEALRSSANVLQQLSAMNGTLYLTEGEEAVAVLMSVSEYVRTAEKNRVMEAICRGLKDIACGNVMDDQTFAEELSAEFGHIDEP